MANLLLDLLLYNQRIKNLANIFLDWPPLLRNPLYQYLSRWQVKKIVDRYQKVPFSLRIENTNVCNARCYMCPHPIMRRTQGFMDRELYQKIIDQAAALGIGFINLHNFGEPLLDKDFCQKVSYAKAKGIEKVTTNTNGQLLSPQLVEGLIEAGLDEIFVSIDAASQEVFEKIRIGLDFNKVRENVLNLADLRKKKKKDKPIIIVDFLESDLNRHEKDLFMKQWSRKVDKVCISKIHDWSGKKKNVLRSSYKNYVAFSHLPCRLPFTELLINWDGTASICCQDTEGEVIVGDAKKETLAQIWQSKLLNTVRAKHLAIQTENLPLCANCKLRTFWWAF